MNKTDLAALVSEKAGISKKAASDAVTAVLEGIGNALEGGEIASFIGFGSFKVVQRAEREGRNPQTGKTIKIPAKNVVKFSAGKQLKERIQAKKKTGRKKK